MGKQRTALSLLVILCLSLFAVLEIGAVEAEARTIVVPDDYSTIQEAVDNAFDGDTVFVKSGTYNESLSIEVAISLVGEDPATTTINGDMRLSGTAVLIQHNNVNVTGFTIQPASYHWTCRGVHLLHVSYCNVFGNIVRNNEEGIWIYGCSTINITGNTISGNGPGIVLQCSPANLICGNTVKNNNLGVRFNASPNNTLCNNIISNNRYGIDDDSDGNSILDNTIEHNRASGIQMSGVNNILKGNKLNNNTLNFDIDAKLRVDYHNSQFVNDVDSSNTIEGKPIIYWINKQDQTVPEDSAFVALVNCKNITVENLNVTKNPVAIILESTVNSKVTSNSVDAPDYVIFVHNSEGNTIANNLVSNGGIGIFLHYSTQNELIGNTVTDASNGITLEASEENFIDGNIILECKCGIGFGGSDNNTVRKNVVTECESLALTIWDNSSQNMFYLNTFINNTRNLQEPREWAPVLPLNSWDNGTVGNYWSNYNGTDNTGDGIGDTPYIIDEDNQDNYPLTEPYAIPEFPTWAPFLILLIGVLIVSAIYKQNLRRE